MNRLAQGIIVPLVMVCSGTVLAQVSINTLERTTGASVRDGNSYVDQQGETYLPTGPYLLDLGATAEGMRARGFHDTSVIVDGSSLSVTGSLLASVEFDVPGNTESLEASTTVWVTFSTSEPSTFNLDVSKLGTGELWFIDTTDNILIDHPEPGDYSYSGDIVPGHEYLFQVVVFAQLFGGDTGLSNESSATLSLIVGPSEVATDAASWGSVKALFRN